MTPATIGWSQESRVILCKHGLEVSIIQQVYVSGPCANEKGTYKVKTRQCSKITFSVFVPGIILGTFPSLEHSFLFLEQQKINLLLLSPDRSSAIPSHLGVLRAGTSNVFHTASSRPATLQFASAAETI